MSDIGVCESTEGKDSSMWFVGVIMSIFASIASNFGLNVQKLSMNREQLRNLAKRRPYIRQPLWGTGLILVVCGSIADFAALGFAAQSLITPVGGITMVANVFFAYAFLGENVTRKDVFATVIICSGVALIPVFADKSESCYTADDLIMLFQRWQFVSYAVVFSIFFFSFWYVTRQASMKRRQYGDNSKEYALARTLHRFGYPTLSGLIGAQDVLFAKATAELIKSSFRGENQFRYISTWLIVVMMVLCIFAQLHFLAMALKHFDAVYVVPVFQCFFISGSIIAGAVYYREFEDFSFSQTIGFIIAVALTLVGVYVLSQRSLKTIPIFRTKEPKKRFKAAVHCVTFLNWRYKYPQWKKKKREKLKLHSSISNEEKGPLLGPRKKDLVTRSIGAQTIVTGQNSIWSDGKDKSTLIDIQSRIIEPKAGTLGTALPSDIVRNTAIQRAHTHQLGRRYPDDNDPFYTVEEDDITSSNLYPNAMSHMNAQPQRGNILRSLTEFPQRPGFQENQNYSRFDEPGMPQFAFNLDQNYSEEYLRRKQQELRTYTRNVYKPDMLAPVPTGLGLSFALSEVGGYIKRKFLPSSSGRSRGNSLESDNVLSDASALRNTSQPNDPFYTSHHTLEVLGEQSNGGSTAVAVGNRLASQGQIYRTEGDTLLTPSAIRSKSRTASIRKESNLSKEQKENKIEKIPVKVKKIKSVGLQNLENSKNAKKMGATETKYTTTYQTLESSRENMNSPIGFTSDIDDPFALGNTLPLKQPKQPKEQNHSKNSK